MPEAACQQAQQRSP